MWLMNLQESNVFARVSFCPQGGWVICCHYPLCIGPHFTWILPSPNPIAGHETLMYSDPPPPPLVWILFPVSNIRYPNTGDLLKLVPLLHTTSTDIWWFPKCIWLASMWHESYHNALLLQQRLKGDKMSGFLYVAMWQKNLVASCIN